MHPIKFLSTVLSTAFQNKLLMITIALSITLLSCKKVIDLPLNTSETQLVIEGNINNLDTVQYVRLTKTKKYFTDNIFEGVVGATVILTQTLKNGDQLTDTLKTTEKDGECIGCFGGYYSSSKIKRCIPGSTYRLDVISEGKKFFAITRMNEVVNLDSLTYKYKKSDPPRTKAGYYVTVYGKEPDTVGNFYRTIVYKNDTIYNGKNVPDYLVTDDKLINGLPIVNELQYPFKENDRARVDLISIEGAMYRYYRTLSREVFSGGNPFAPPGANLVTNIHGDKAFGFFGSFAISRKEIILKKKD